MPIEAPRPQLGEEEGGGFRHLATHLGQQFVGWCVVFAGEPLGGRLFDGRMGHSQRLGLAVDGPSCLVTKQVPDHGGQQVRQPGMGTGYDDHVEGLGEPAWVGVGHHHRGRLVRPEDRHLLGHIVDGGANKAGGTDHDQRLRGQVDVFFVFGGVRGDRLVAELGELDADFLGGNQVVAAAHHRPVPTWRSVASGQVTDLAPQVQHRLHVGGKVGQGSQERRSVGGTRCANGVGQRGGQ